jgi:hypothetical protein
MTTPREKLETLEPPSLPTVEEQNIQIMTTLAQLATALKEQSDRLSHVEDFLSPEKFDNFLKVNLTPLVTNIQKKFEAHEQVINSMRQNTPTGQSGGTLGGIIDLVGKIAEKINFTPKPASSEFSQGAQALYEKIILQDLKAMLRSRGIAEPVSHIVVEGA